MLKQKKAKKSIRERFLHATEVSSQRNFLPAKLTANIHEYFDNFSCNHSTFLGTFYYLKFETK